MMYAVWIIATGEAFSFGTVVADPLPEDMASRQLSDAETTMLADGTGIWDTQTLTIVARPPEP